MPTEQQCVTQFLKIFATNDKRTMSIATLYYTTLLVEIDYCLRLSE